MTNETNLNTPSLRGTWGGFLFILLVLTVSSYAQDSLYYQVGTAGILSSGETAPFWLHSNQFGRYSMSPFSSTTFAEVGKDFRNNGRWYDYGFKANGILRFDDRGAEVYMHEYYAKFRGFGFLDLVVGAREEYLGCQDSILSGGGFLFSTNARPMPKITVGIEQYTGIPFTKGYVQIKGALVHGWMNDPRYVSNTWLHHKYIYIKLGGKLPVNLHYGLNHAAQWGGTHPTYGKMASGFDDYLRIFVGKSGTDSDNSNEYNNAQGNHIVSQSLQLDFKIAGFNLSAYWQNLHEDPPIKYMYKTMNIADGLWGVSLKSNRIPYISGILYEFLNTTDQSGPYHDKDGIIYGGADSYLWNSIYQSGWSFFSRTIGTPFISPAVKSSSGTYYPVNNRLQVHHAGAYGDIHGFRYKALVSVSKSYGTYSRPLPDSPMTCTSVFLEVNKTVPQWFNLEFACALSADFGEIPAVNHNTLQAGGNSFGVCLSVRKRGTIFKYGK